MAEPEDTYNAAIPLTPQGFDKSAPCIVQSTVERYKGQNYRRGERYPDHAPWRLRRRLFRQRRLVHPSGSEPGPSKSPPPPGGEGGPGPRFTAVHRGAGRWGVLDGERVLVTGLDPEEAKTLAADYNACAPKGE